MFEFAPSENTGESAAQGPSRQDMVNYLAQGDSSGGFVSLDAGLQSRILDALANMPGIERSEMLQRLRNMDAKSRTEIVNDIVQTGEGARQDTPQGDTKHYTVKPGDSLSKISHAYNIGLHELIRANPQIKNPDLIHPNQVIHIP